MGIHWVQWFLRGEGVHKLKGMGGRQFSDLRGKENLAKKRGCSVPILEDRVYAMTLPNQLYPKQINFFSYNDCMTVEILQKRLSNK